MTKPVRLRTCRDCKARFSSELATGSDGVRAPRGFYCPTCGERRAREYEHLLRQHRINITRNLWAAYRGWWIHFTPPKGWATILRTESDNCPYCGCLLNDDRSSPTRATAVIDHMDPLSAGGEDSLRNAVYCCFRCNGVKKNKPFTRWLTELPEPFRTQCRAIYIFKHEHQPEAF